MDSTRIKTAADTPSYRHLVAAYSKNPEASLVRLANDLATKKWTTEDVEREDRLHDEEYRTTGEAKNIVDRYIIQEIGKSKSDVKDKVRHSIRQSELQKIWEKLNEGHSIVEMLPKRMARFRQYRDIPFQKDASDDLVENLARKHYSEDGSHGWNHIQEVLGRARTLKGSDLSPEERAACLFHDSSLLTGPRETHADDSAAISRQVLKEFFRRRQIERIAKAIARHRASYKGRRYTNLDNLLAAADRSDLNLEKLIHRCYDYRRENGWTQDEAIINDTLSHIKDKYGRNGYAFKTAPKIYLDKNKTNLNTFWKALDNLSYDNVKEIISSR